MAPSATLTTTTTATPTVPITKAAEPVKYKTGDPDLAFVPDEKTSPPTFTDKYEERAYLKKRLALGFRVFAQYGFCEGIAGHITLRDPVDPHSFWVNPYGIHFSLIGPDDLIRVDHDGNVIDGGKNRRLNYAAYAIHASIHKARPDVLCAAHAHTIYGRAMCATGRTLDMLTQDFCSFYKDHVLYPNFDGLVLASEEGDRISKCLGHRKAALLGNHGLLTAGPTVEATVSWFILFEKCCRIQLAADASSYGTGKPLTVIGDEEAKLTWQGTGTAATGYFQGLSLFQVAEREFGESTFLGRGMEPA